MKHILVCLTRDTPQVITESIYAFKAHRNIDIEEIRVVTTKGQSEGLLRSLTAPRLGGKGPLEALCCDYDIPPISISEDSFLVPRDPSGNLIEDVRAVDEMNSFAQFMLQVVREFTSDEGVCLHASIAGGRKTMSFYFGYAMGIYARQQDSLSHVFVTPAYEDTDFFYPSRSSQMVMSRKGSIDCAEAIVTLSDIPFVRLRDFLPLRVLEKEMTFEDSKSIYESINAPIALEIDVESSSIICSGQPVKLSPANLAFYMVLVDDLLGPNEGFDCPVDATPDKALAFLYLTKRLELDGIRIKFANLEDAVEYCEKTVTSLKDNELDGIRDGIKKAFFNDRKNKIANSLRKELPESIWEHYDVDAIDKVVREGATKKVSYFGINLEPKYVVSNAPDA